MERRLLLAVIVSIAILVLYQDLVIRRYRRRGASRPATHAAAQPRAAPAPPPATPAPLPGLALAPDPAAGAVVVRTPLYEARFTMRGGRLEGLRLLRYRTTIAEDSPPLEMVVPGPMGELPLALDLGPGSPRFDTGLRYSAPTRELELGPGEEKEVVLTARGPGGLTVERRLTFSGDSYAFGLAVRLRGPGKATPPGLVLTSGTQLGGRERRELEALARTDGKVRRLGHRKLKGRPVVFEDPLWVGLGDRYFLAAALASGGDGERARLLGADGLAAVEIFAHPDPEGWVRYTVFVGPKDMEVLGKVGSGLAGAINFGWFSFVAIPLLRALELLHRLTGNFGVDIVILTLLVRLALIPLTQVSMRNMREMQRLQPQMKRLRERYKDDQARLQKELMELYRRHRVNPLSGCLPMILQIPIFFGLYNALRLSIDLRHAPFVLWIRDLSAAECYPGAKLGTCNFVGVAGVGIPVLVILMGLSMLVQQWLTPAAGDPTQQRMMMIMPLVFTVMFVAMPSGLVLYWLTSNLVSIAQQYAVNRPRG